MRLGASVGEAAAAVIFYLCPRTHAAPDVSSCAALWICCLQDRCVATSVCNHASFPHIPSSQDEVIRSAARRARRRKQTAPRLPAPLGFRRTRRQKVGGLLCASSTTKRAEQPDPWDRGSSAVKNSLSLFLSHSAPPSGGGQESPRWENSSFPVQDALPPSLLELLPFCMFVCSAGVVNKGGARLPLPLR